MKRACLAILAITFAGCTTSPEITAWNMAKEVNTPAAYENFAHRYPKSGHVDEAQEMIEKSKMDRILKADSVAECIVITKANHDPKIAATVADLAFKAATKETSVETLYDLLLCFKGHKGVPAVRSRLEELEFKGAGEDASPRAMEYFLFRYPESRFAAEGRKLLSEKSYEQVKAWANQYGYKAFLQKFPESPRAGEVRGWIKADMPQAVSSNTRNTLADAVENRPWLKRYGCALALASKIRKNAGDVDSLRHDLYKLEKGAVSGNLPEACSSVDVAARSDVGEALDEALRMMVKTEELRNDLASHWKVYGQHDEITRAAIGASSKVADELESAELSEDVLGVGPLGGLDVGREKGSVSARKALELFRVAEKIIARDREDVKRLLLEADSLYKPLQFYITSGLVAE